MQNPDSFPNSHYAPQSPPSRPNDSCCANFVRRLRLAIVFLFIIITTIIILAWLVFHPRLPAFRVNSLSVSNFTLHNNSQLTANFTVELNVTNPNQSMDLLIEQLDISVRYHRTTLCKTKLVHSFELKKMGQEAVSAVLGTGSGFSVSGKTAMDMGVGLNKRVVSFNVKVEVGARFRSSFWPSKQRSMVVLCENLDVGFSSAEAVRNFTNGRRDCCRVSLI